MLGLLCAPVAALVFAVAPSDLVAAVTDRAFAPALWLSARTSLLSLALVVLGGTPLAWWLAVAPARAARAAELAVALPIVIPPAVLGIALLVTFGRAGLVGRGLELVGVHLPFTTAAVVLAQVVVSAPFYIHAAAAAFRRVDPDLLLVARTLGQRPAGVFARVVVPLAWPGLLAGAAVAWARALGEFTQTMPLAIYTSLESDVQVAVALALVLAAASVALLGGLQLLRGSWTSPAAGAPR